MNKRHKIIISIEIIIAIVMVIALTVFAAQPGSTDDPLVAKSYVDDKFEQLVEAINQSNTNSSNNNTNEIDADAIVTEVLTKLEELKLANGEGTGGSVEVPLGVVYTPVYLTNGQTILGEEGSEFIMRSGNGKIYITGVDGITNVTTGKEMKNGEKVTKNHLLVIPRNDGRGVKVSEGTWFLVRGGYQIV